MDYPGPRRRRRESRGSRERGRTPVAAQPRSGGRTEDATPSLPPRPAPPPVARCAPSRRQGPQGVVLPRRSVPYWKPPAQDTPSV